MLKIVINSMSAFSPLLFHRVSIVRDLKILKCPAVCEAVWRRREFPPKTITWAVGAQRQHSGGLNSSKVFVAGPADTTLHINRIRSVAPAEDGPRRWQNLMWTNYRSMGCSKRRNRHHHCFIMENRPGLASHGEFKHFTESIVKTKMLDR